MRRMLIGGLAVLVVAVAGFRAASVSAPAEGPSLSQAEIETLASELVAFSRFGVESEAPRLLPNAQRGEGQSSLSAAPVAQSGAGMLLGPADLQSSYVVASSGQRTQFGVGWHVQTLRRAGKHLSFVETDGNVVVRSFALVAPSPGEADRVFDQASRGVFEGGQEAPIPVVGQRSRGVVSWSMDPFGLAIRIVLFRAGSAIGYVLVAGYEAPTRMDDVVALARIMAARAGR